VAASLICAALAIVGGQNPLSLLIDLLAIIVKCARTLRFPFA
jgi:hypothetical protein